MRSFSLTVLFMTIALSMNAQKFNVQSAINHIDDKEYKEAMDYLSDALEHEDTKNMAKTWYYRGQLYKGIAASKDTAVQSLAEEPLVEAFKSLQKAIKLGEKGSIYKQRAGKSLLAMGPQAFNAGAEQFNQRNFEHAAKLFSMAASTAGMQNKLDTLAVYNAALCLEQAGKQDSALTFYKKLSQVGYKGAEPFMRQAVIYQKMDKTDKMVEVLKEGSKKYPSNVRLINTLSNYYLRSKNFEEAQRSLKASLENDPDNPLLHYNLGRVYDRLYQNKRSADSVNEDKVREYFELSVKEYKKATESDTAYTDAFYNLGALYYNEGAELNNKASGIDDEEQYSKVKGRSTKYFKKAIPHLKKAHELDPDDLNTMSSLVQAYAQTDKMEQYKKLKEKLEKAQQQQNK